MISNRLDAHPVDRLAIAATAAIERKVEAARTNFHSFAEFVMVDETGVSLKQAVIHRTWRTHIEWCWRVGLIPAILAPFGHGKTSQITIGGVAYELGHDVNMRVKIVCQNDAKAMERVMGIQATIFSKRYQLCYPGVRSVSKERARSERRQSKQTQHELFLDRPGFSIDPSVQAAGVLSAGTGGRADLMVFDDIVDQKNAVDEPALRDKVVDNVDNVWMNRCEPSARVLFVGTPWHQADFTHRILNRPAWCVLRQYISEDFQRIDQEVYNAGSVAEPYPIPLATRAALNVFAATTVDNSSNIAEIGYDRSSKTLEVQFRSGSRYHFFSVPLEVYEAFSGATSKGSFFSQVIKERYPFRKILAGQVQAVPA